MSIDDLIQPNCHWVLCAPVHLPIDAEKRNWLTDEELQRSKRFRKQEDCQRYQLAQILKRYFLARILGTGGHDLQFITGDKGKPFCQNANAPHFNLSHSGDWVLLAISSVAEVGVDVELAGRETTESVINYVLNPKQQAHVASTADPIASFMIYWTQKEAISKALGIGLSIGLHSVHCNGELGDSSMNHSGRQLKLHSRKLDDNYLLSVATAAHSIPNFYVLNNWHSIPWSITSLT